MACASRSHVRLTCKWADMAGWQDRSHCVRQRLLWLLRRSVHACACLGRGSHLCVLERGQEDVGAGIACAGTEIDTTSTAGACVCAPGYSGTVTYSDTAITGGCVGLAFTSFLSVPVSVYVSLSVCVSRTHTCTHTTLTLTSLLQPWLWSVFCAVSARLRGHFCVAQ